jgi:hypothetical protein
VRAARGKLAPKFTNTIMHEVADDGFMLACAGVADRFMKPSTVFRPVDSFWTGSQP